ncbi:MAG: universal stress protein [Firmicutes bacterium]|nr:universal stress protein [Bacillota bacterium]
MSNLKVLVPLDGTEKSMESLVWLKKYFKKESTDVTLIYVAQVIYTNSMAVLSTFPENEVDASYNIGEKILANAAEKLDGYKVKKTILPGSIADTIINEAIEGSIDLIVMTKSSQKGFSRIFGSVANKVVRDSKVAVLVVP